jgi:hypothetical protein
VSTDEILSTVSKTQESIKNIPKKLKLNIELCDSLKFYKNYPLSLLFPPEGIIKIDVAFE